MVEKSFVTEQDFAIHQCGRLHTRNNPGFLKGTVVEQAVADEWALKRISRCDRIDDVAIAGKAPRAVRTIWITEYLSGITKFVTLTPDKRSTT